MSSSATILDRIMERKRQEVTTARARAPLAELRERARELSPPRDFIQGIASVMAADRPAIIAEVKRASPSRGTIYPGPGFDPAAIAQGYAEHGAACISCLTDRDFFQGDGAYIAAIRERVGLPVLRKDFLYDPYQVVEARAWGADAVLLIMAVLSVSQARELEDAAREQGMAVLVEVHDETELEQAHELLTPLIGINNRDLKRFVTDLETSARLAARMAPGRIAVAESGINRGEELRRLRASGLGAFLIGGALMRQANPGLALAELLREV